MKNNIKSMYAVCLVACLMSLANIDYMNLSVLDIIVIIIVLIAILSIVYNMIVSRRK